MQLPSNWEEISVYQFQELRALNPSDSVFEYYLDVLDIISDEDVDDLSVQEAQRLFNEVKWVRKEPHKVFQKEVCGYVAKPIKDVLLEEFLDLEYYMEKGILENMTTMAAIFYRKTKLNEWSRIVYEPYEYDAVRRGEEFLDLPITHIYGLVEDWLKYRHKLVGESYAELFDGGDISQEDLEALDPEERSQVIKEQNEQRRFTKWAWESVLDLLTQGDLTKYNDVLNMKLIFVLNQLSRLKETKEGH